MKTSLVPCDYLINRFLMYLMRLSGAQHVTVHREAIIKVRKKLRHQLALINYISRLSIICLDD